MTIVLLALLALAAALCFASTPAFAAGTGSVELGIAVQQDERAALPGDGKSGSVDLGISVGLDATDRLEGAAPGDGRPGRIPIGISVGYLLNSEVVFVGHYCNDDGSVDESKPAEYVKGAPVEYGGSPAAPADDALKRTYTLDGTELDYWVDGWYLADPSVDASAAPVSLDQIVAAGDPLTVHFLWKRGYAVRLDANNGTNAEAAAAFGGAVSGSPYVAVPREVDDPDTYMSTPFPAATRPGYEFAGWYFQDGTKADKYGRAVLDDANADGSTKDPVVAEGGTLPWSFFEANKGGTLYAKWVLPADKVVRIHLEEARNDGVADVDVWFWDERGYAFARPEADCEADQSFAIVAEAADAPATLPITVGQNPDPQSSTQYFTGWGYSVTDASGKLVARPMVDCAKRTGEAGSTKVAYDYAFGEWAFNLDYVKKDESGHPVWAGSAEADAATGAPQGQRLASWSPLFKTARIDVDAPFKVTFTKDKGTDEETWQAYEAKDLTWTADKADQWIVSAQQAFTNNGDTDVYVSRIECAPAGAESLLPEGTKGLSLFSLGTSAGGPEAGGAAIRFGYAGEARDVSVAATDAARRIVLPNAAGKNVTQLYFGLNIHDAGFDQGQVMPGNAANPTYAAGLANVKYTYSVVL